MKPRNSTPSVGAAPHRLTPGQTVTARQVTTIRSDRVRIPAPDALTHVQFRRFAACPVCNVHLRSFARRHAEIVAAGIHELVVFHSSIEAMLPYQGTLPFAAIADPGRELYTEFGVENSVRANLHPRVWSAPLRASSWYAVARGLRAGGRPGPQGDSMLGLPADFLIGPDGRVLAAHYGRHANDQWSVDELLRIRTRSVR